MCTWCLLFRRLNGQSSIAYSQSSETDPVKQGMWGIFEVFFDTIVVCTFTALVILCTGVWQTGEAGSTLAITAFTSALGGVGKVIASIGLMMFAGSTVLAFCTFIGLTCENVFGKTGRWIGQIGFVILAFVGGMVGVDILLGWADFGNSLTLTLNIIGLLCFQQKDCTVDQKLLRERKLFRRIIAGSPVTPSDVAAFLTGCHRQFTNITSFSYTMLQKADRFHLLPAFFTSNRNDFTNRHFSSPD
ncbi:alanine:cation symporter family protein [Hungatella sp.]|uniref:alanine:cation symporter family protein n=1 Tax=Hungatella sp. TaxID=2613924 RepID=UPI0039917164